MQDLEILCQRENARMLIGFYSKKMLMTASKKKKTVLYGVFAAAVVFAFVQVTYFNEAYSPLQVLSDARSEARRLLRFITLYHYQCNATIQGTNISQWPICIEKVGGLNLVLGGPRVMYSVGPVPDYPLERILAINFSYNVHVFHKDPLSSDFIQSTKNKTKLFKTTIVPNDPSDYGRNMYETKTLNNVFDLLKHPVVDILKIESVVDKGHSHELLYYLVKDKLLSRVRQLHFALYIDKVDDDFLYSWYKTLYMLFQSEGFRLYHSSASDSLCLQVTLMESCVYYMSWIRDPGPEMFVLYPPAIDGSIGFEVERLGDYLEDTEATCGDKMEISIPAAKITLCKDKTNIDPTFKSCQLVLIRNHSLFDMPMKKVYSPCNVVMLELDVLSHEESRFWVKTHSADGSTSKNKMTLAAALQQYMQITMDNILYLDIQHYFWPVLDSVLNSGALFNANQLLMDVRDILVDHRPSEIRRRFSELKRVEAYGLRKYEIINQNDDRTLYFHSKHLPTTPTAYRLNYLKSGPRWHG